MNANRLLMLGTLGLLITTATVHAEADPRLAAEIDAALLRLADAGALPSGNSGSLEIEQPARTRHELGAVLGLSGEGEGAPVLAVSPGGAAERLGLRVGDRVLALNGVTLDRDMDGERLRDAIDEGALSLQIQREGKRLELRGLADSTTLPGYRLLLAGAIDDPSSCGRLSVFDVFPRSKDVYPVIVIAIDGRYPGDQTSFRLDPGLHRITVAEHIDTDEFTSLGLFQRNLARGSGPKDLFRHVPGEGSVAVELAPQPNARAGSRYKDLEIEVRAGTTYRIAAQFLPEHRQRVRHQRYWQPIVWRESNEICR